MIFAACFKLRGHDTHIDFLWVLFLVCRIGPLMKTYGSLLRLNKGFRLFNFLQSASWIWITKSDFLLSANVMVSCNVLTRWAHNLECQMNLTDIFASSATEETSSRYNVLSVEYFFDKPLAFNWFPNFSCLIVSLVRAVLIRRSNTWDEVYFLVLLTAPLLFSCFDFCCDLLAF